MTRRLWWGNRNNNDERATMGNSWAGDVDAKPVRPVPPIETAAHDDFVARERERAEQIKARDMALYGAALTAFLDRVRALPELGGALGSDQQFAELDTIESLLSAVMGRRAILRSRQRNGTGLFRQMTGQQLPPYPACACAVLSDDGRCVSCGRTWQSAEAEGEGE